MSYQVKLDVFEGPFDLLLQLIARRRVDVTEIDLAEITADFLANLVAIEDLDLETATRFLVVAATLIELKAARLLPADERDEIDDLLGDARDMLYARLLEYRAFRDVARVLAHRLVRHEASMAREAPDEPWMQRLVPDTPLPVDASGLAALAAGVTAPRPDAVVDLTHIRRSYITIRDAARELLGSLPDPDGRAEFGSLVGERDRGDRVVFFLAVLELFKLGHVDLEQDDHRGPLVVERRDAALDLDALSEIEDQEIEDEDHGSQDQDEQGGGQAGAAHDPAVAFGDAGTSASGTHEGTGPDDDDPHEAGPADDLGPAGPPTHTDRARI